jgi:hypothetical protein
MQEPNGRLSRWPAAVPRIGSLTFIVSSPFWIAAIFSRPFQGAFWHPGGDYHPVLASFEMFVGPFVVMTVAVAIYLQLGAVRDSVPFLGALAAMGAWSVGGLVFMVITSLSAIGFGQGTSRTNLTAWGAWVSICCFAASAYIAYLLDRRLRPRFPTAGVAAALLLLVGGGLAGQSEMRRRLILYDATQLVPEDVRVGGDTHYGSPRVQHVYELAPWARVLAVPRLRLLLHDPDAADNAVIALQEIESCFLCGNWPEACLSVRAARRALVDAASDPQVPEAARARAAGRLSDDLGRSKADLDCKGMTSDAE